MDSMHSDAGSCEQRGSLVWSGTWFLLMSSCGEMFARFQMVSRSGYAFRKSMIDGASPISPGNLLVRISSVLSGFLVDSFPTPDACGNVRSSDFKDRTQSLSHVTFQYNEKTCTVLHYGKGYICFMARAKGMSRVCKAKQVSTFWTCARSMNTGKP